MFPKIPDVSNILEFCEPLSHIFQHAIKVCTRPQIMETDQTPVQKKCQSSIHDGPPCVPVHCALPTTCSTDSLSLIDMYAGVLEKNRSTWFCRNPLTSHLHKTASIKRHTDSKSQLQIKIKLKTGSTEKTHKLVWVSCFVRFV